MPIYLLLVQQIVRQGNLVLNNGAYNIDFDDGDKGENAPLNKISVHLTAIIFGQGKHIGVGRYMAIQ